MWNKRTEDENPPRPSAPRPTPESARRDFAAAPPPVSRNTPVGAPPSAAVIGSSMVIVGEIQSREELYVDGEIKGSLELEHRLTIGPNGKVSANIRAREVVILGRVEGNVEVTDRITIRRSGNLVGDIKTAGIVIEDGAYFKGSIDIIKPAPAKQPAPAPEMASATK